MYCPLYAKILQAIVQNYQLKRVTKLILFALQVLDDYSEELQKKFLLFTTGSDRVPVGGMGEMTFKITKMVTKTPKTKDAENKLMQNGVPVKLPESHTCFNQLVLPGEISN